MKNKFVMMKNLTRMFQIKKNEKYAFKLSQHYNKKINWRDFCDIKKRKKRFITLNNYLKFTRCWWLRCKRCNNCKSWKISMIDKMKYNRFFFENLNFQLMKIIEFNEYEIKIDSNFFRSIIRVKRIYRIFYYRKILLHENIEIRNKYMKICKNICKKFDFLNASKRISILTFDMIK